MNDINGIIILIYCMSLWVLFIVFSIGLLIQNCRINKYSKEFKKEYTNKLGGKNDRF